MGVRVSRHIVYQHEEDETMAAKLNRKLRMGMVGGGPGAFIGAVHRAAANLDGQIELVAGAFDIDPAKSKVQGEELYLDPGRVYGTYPEMMATEKSLPDTQRIDLVSIVTPNNVHFPVAKAAAEAGFHIVCEKPMTTTLDQAKDLVKIVRQTGIVFALTHAYTGYPMVKAARQIVADGKIGKVQKIVVEYPQGWLLAPIEREGQMQASWRTDPKQAGASCCMGDIGSHCENLARYITGLGITELCADLTSFVDGRELDDDGNVLIHLEGGAKGILFASQISTGEENNLRIRVYGTEGALEWHQENPNYLWERKADGPALLHRHGANYAYLGEAAVRCSRLPFGHPEALIEAFANIYTNVADTVRAKMAGETPSPVVADFPTVEDGARGLAFIETCVASAAAGATWAPMKSWS